MGKLRRGKQCTGKSKSSKAFEVLFSGLWLTQCRVTLVRKMSGKTDHNVIGDNSNLSVKVKLIAKPSVSQLACTYTS